MSSIQQVAMASVCLVAAFAFGSFINQSEIDQSAQVEANSPDGMRSLMDTEIAIPRVPDSTPRMKPKLSARLPMPIIDNADTLQNGSFAGDIPPPSDVRGRGLPTPTNLGSSFSKSPEANELVADAPSFAPNLNTESAMPVVNSQDFGSSPNLADSMRAPFQTDERNAQAPPVENAPVFAAGEFNGKTPPANRFDSQPEQTLTAPAIKAAPTFPSLSQDTQTYRAAKPSIATANDTRQPTSISDPAAPFKTARRDQFRYSKPQQINAGIRDQNSLMPIPSLKQTVTIDDPGGAFGNRESRQRDSQSNWSNSPRSVLNTNEAAYNPELVPGPQQQFQTQRQVTRLPLQLNSNAHSKLTRLRDSAIQKISLSTTQFSEYVVERGDSLQSIAAQHFGKPDYYLDIYLANRDRLRFPGDLRDGMSIRIPVYQQ